MGVCCLLECGRCGAQVVGGRKMGLRVADPDYLDHVDRWWGELLPRLAPYLHTRGGPIILTQARPIRYANVR